MKWYYVGNGAGGREWVYTSKIILGCKNIFKLVWVDKKIDITFEVSFSQ